MKYEEAKKIIQEKNLTHYKWFEDPNYEPNVVGINKNGDEYEVYVTSERGTPSGIKQFKTEEEALDNFISRVESLNRLIKKRPNSFW
ncbi:Imm59 family immunity protein [Sporolactobacillus laevolacticus]|uniref:Imm59 family immunity protein n=1 Tax=Sporolactobacillus laevolacticus TaxID=33018 RepID=UPI0025B3C49F|nr:Imm59 family immunity protein [Sporolactobacillus laevolacticus]MDN3955295.1 Imm59 family immunity protein [Sporolactobacillus laevolacticus]